MQGDELIQYGFKRIVEELEKMNERVEKMNKQLEKLEQIEQNTFTASGEAIKQELLLEKIENSAAICMYNSSGLMRDVRKMSTEKDGGQEKG